MKRAIPILAAVVVVVALGAVVVIEFEPLAALVSQFRPEYLLLVACPAAIVLPLLALCFHAGLAADRIGWMSSSGGRVRKIARFLLPTSNVLAVLAALVGLGLGFLLATLGAAFTCFDSCPTPDDYFARLVTGTLNLMTPCIALEALTLVALVAYHAAKREPLRALAPTLILVLGNLVGVAALTAQYWQGQSSLPVTPDGLLVEDAVTAWGFTWGMAVLIVAVAPPAGFAILQWLRWMRV